MRAVHDANARWRAFVARWQDEFPELAASCREAVPLLERTYGALIAELGEYLRQQGAGALDNDFSLQEFLDRFGMRLAQLGTILNLVAPLAEAAGSQGETS
jgi:anti-sigma-K factor RskA